MIEKTQTLQSAFDPFNNSLTFIRFCLAAMVIFSHSYDLGGFGDDPLKQYCGVTIGEIAVNGFFAISGYLITTSFTRSRSTAIYTWKRLIRIFPGYWVCLLTTALILAPVLCALQYDGLPPIKHPIDNPFVSYVASNFWLRINQQGIYELFLDNPARGVFNGSLWTLFPELLCYALVIFLGKLGLLKSRRKFLVLTLLLACFTVHSVGPYLLLQSKELGFYGALWYLLRLNTLTMYFLAGAVLFLFAHRIPFNNSIYALSLFLLVACIVIKGYFWIGVFIFPMALFGIAIKIPFSEFHKFGDYSYGLYLYAYPIQQTIVSFQLVPSNPILFFIVSTLVTFPLAWLSWNFVERHSLKLKTINFGFS